MSTLLWGAVSNGVMNRDVEVATRNTPPIQPDEPPAEMDHAPDYNELQTDNDANLGFTTHQLASDWHESEQYVPADIGVVTIDRNQIVDRQIATSGTAAQREASGQYGHGTAAYAVGIEPTIRDGATYGADYFAGNEHEANQTTTYETGVQATFTYGNQGDVSAQGKISARDAAQAGNVSDPYTDFLRG